MRNFFRRFQVFLLFSAASTLGCSSSTLRLESTPEKAKVALIQVGSNKRQELGQTPIAESEVPKDFLGMPVIVEFSYPGYQTEAVLVPDFSGVKVEIKKNLVNSQAIASGDKVARIQSLNESIDKLFEVVRKVQVNKKEEALKLLGEIKAKHSDLSAIYEIEQNVRTKFFCSCPSGLHLSQYRLRLGH